MLYLQIIFAVFDQVILNVLFFTSYFKLCYSQEGFNYKMLFYKLFMPSTKIYL